MSTHEIEIEYGERYTDFVMGMYVDTSLADDIDMLGWNLCDCDDALFLVEIGNCKIISEKVHKGKALVMVAMDGKGEVLKEIVKEQFLADWEDFIWRVKIGLHSRSR